LFQPRIVFLSSILPSAMNFFMVIRSFLGSVSELSTGLEIACMTRGTA
jgi:hypothetical protein